MLYDSNDKKSGKPRILIYSTEENLNLMTNYNNWYTDDTFSSVPSIFYQLYTIYGIQYSNVLPFLFALLSNKTKETYVRLIEIILNLKLELKPTTFMLDFELSTKSAIKKCSQIHHYMDVFCSLFASSMETCLRLWISY